MTPFNYSGGYPAGYRISGKTDWPDSVSGANPTYNVLLQYFVIRSAKIFGVIRGLYNSTCNQYFGMCRAPIVHLIGHQHVYFLKTNFQSHAGVRLTINLLAFYPQPEGNFFSGFLLLFIFALVSIDSIC